MLRKVWMIAAALALVAPATAQQRIADKVVAVVGNSHILYSEVAQTSARLVQQRREMGYTSDRDPMNEALEQLLLQKLLYNQALIDSVQINLSDIAGGVEDQLQAMIEQEGSIAALEAKEHRPIFDIRESLRRNYQESYYAQGMQREVVSKVKITPGEVERYYRSRDKDSLPIIPEQYVYAHITKFPLSMVRAKQNARQRLLELRERVISQGADFGALARMYSEDAATRMRGGEMEPMTLDMLVSDFSSALEKLKPGQISEVVETEYGFHIIQLIEQKGQYYTFRHILIKPYYTYEELAESDRLLDSLANLVRLDSMTFEQAAKRYSDDPYSRENGGLVSNHDLLELSMQYVDARMTQTRFTRDDLGRTRSGINDYNVIRRMRPGEISAAFQTEDLRGNQLSKIIKLIEIIPSHNASLGDDYLFLEQYALEAKKEQEFLRWLDKKIAGMYIRIAPEFRDGAFQNKNWVK